MAEAGCPGPEQPADFRAVVRDVTAGAGTEAKPPGEAMLTHTCEQCDKRVTCNKARATH